MTRLVLVLLAAAVVAAPGQARPTAASLHLTDARPLSVLGNGFAARERVTLVANANGTTRRTVVTATARGVFAARFTSLSATTCPGYSVRATGDRGSRATLKPRPAECPPPPPPLAP